MNHLDSTDSPEAAESAEAAPKSTRHHLFFGDDGLRAGWSFLLYILMAAVCIWFTGFLIRHFHLLARTPKPAPGAPPREMTFHDSFIPEALGFASFLLPAVIMSFIERRPFRRYGLTAARFLPDLFFGLAVGLLALSGLVATLYFTHHLAFDVRLLHGVPLILFGLKWLLLFFFVGLLEEFSTRGYIQYTVSRGVAGMARALNPSFRHSHALGFWVAAFLFSVLLFMAGHLNNPGESIPGILCVGLAGATFAFSLYRTGSLWFAIGLHTTWDWAQSFLYGVPDSGTMVQGHLFATHPLGSALFSGAADGPEGSLFVLPTLLLVLLIIHVALPRRAYFLTPDQALPVPVIPPSMI